MRDFEKIVGINVNDKTDKKKSGGTELTYLSWAWAWAEFMKVYPDATYEIMKDSEGKPYFGDEEVGYMVYTKVTVEDVTHEMWLPVMDSSNKTMKKNSYKYSTKFSGEKVVEAINMFEINKAIMRCLTKNLAMFGLGLYIYAGEDLPEPPEDGKEPLPLPDTAKKDKPSPIAEAAVKKAEEVKAKQAAKQQPPVQPTPVQTQMEVPDDLESVGEMPMQHEQKDYSNAEIPNIVTDKQLEKLYEIAAKKGLSEAAVNKNIETKAKCKPKDMPIAVYNKLLAGVSSLEDK